MCLSEEEGALIKGIVHVKMRSIPIHTWMYAGPMLLRTSPWVDSKCVTAPKAFWQSEETELSRFETDSSVS